MTLPTPYELLTKWIKELRSGKRKQTNGTLRNRDGECCLGVYASIIPEEVYKAGRYVCKLADDSIMITHMGTGVNYSGDLPPHFAEEYLGFKHEDHNHLIAMNDYKRNNFDEIADHIQQHILPRHHPLVSNT